LSKAKSVEVMKKKEDDEELIPSMKKKKKKHKIGHQLISKH
jgi:hypothetical protein